MYIGSVKIDEGDVVTLMPITEQLIVQLPVLSTEMSGFDDISVEGCADTAVLAKVMPLF